MKNHRYDEFGREIPDQTPIEVPFELKRPLSLQEQIAQFVKGYASRQAEAAGAETFDEADDFNVDGDDEAPLSRYQEIMTEAKPEYINGQGADADASPAAPAPAPAPTAPPAVPPPTVPPSAAPAAS